MAFLEDHSIPIGITGNLEQPSWAHEVAASLGTRPSRASSLVSTRTKFSTTTFQEDAKSIDLSVSGQHFRISRDGSKVTSINHEESLPSYPFGSVQLSLQHDRRYHRYAISDPGSLSDRRTELVEDCVEGQAPISNHGNLASLTSYMDTATLSSDEAEDSLPVPPFDNTNHSESSDHSFSGSLNGLDGSLDKTMTLISMVVRIQRAWRSYVQYRSHSSKPGEPMGSPVGSAYLSRTADQTPITSGAFRLQAPNSTQLGRSGGAAVSVSVPKKSVSFLDKDLPIPTEAANAPVGSPFLTSVLRRSGARDVGRSSHAATPSNSRNVVLPMFSSAKGRSSIQPYKPIFPNADGWESTEQLSLRKWFTGDGSNPFRDTDELVPSPTVDHASETMDSENDVSNHYTRVIRFIDRDHRRALHGRDKEMAELRERLNEKDIVYRQELRAQDFLIEDLRRRLEHMEETAETEIERARNQVEDVWESRWKDRDFHLRERMQRMESEMQRTMDTTIAEREAFWRSKYAELRRTLDIPEGLPDN